MYGTGRAELRQPERLASVNFETYNIHWQQIEERGVASGHITAFPRVLCGRNRSSNCDLRADHSKPDSECQLLSLSHFTKHFAASGKEESAA